LNNFLFGIVQQHQTSNKQYSTMNANVIKLTPANAHQYIGHEIQFKTRGHDIVKRIINVSETGLSITIDHPDLKNNLQLVSRNVYVILPTP